MSKWLLLSFTIQFLGAPNRYDDPAEVEFFRAEAFFQKKQLVKARASFNQTVLLLKKKIIKTRKDSFLLNLGNAEILYYLAQIDWLEKKKFSSCRSLSKALTFWDGLPSDWQTWNISSLRVERNQKALFLFDTRYLCKSQVLSLIEVKGMAKQAKIEQRISIAVKGKPAKWKLVNSPISVEGNKPVLLRFSLAGYKISEQEITVERWSRKKIMIVFQKLPKRRRPPPPPPTTRRKKEPPLPPKGISPWVWVGVGAGVVAVGTVTVIMVTRGRSKVLQPQGRFSAFH